MTANHSRHSLKKSNGAKSDGSDSLLGLKRGKEVKNCKKHGENYESFRVNCSFFESERANQEQIRAKEQRAQAQTPNPVSQILLYSNIGQFTPYHGCCYDHSSLLCLLCCFVTVFYDIIIINHI